MGPTLNLEVRKQNAIAIIETGAPALIQKKTSSQIGKENHVKTPSSIVIVHKDLKGNAKIVSSCKRRSKSEDPPLEVP